MAMFDNIHIIMKDLFTATYHKKIIVVFKSNIKYRLFITVYDFDVVSLKLRLMPA